MRTCILLMVIFLAVTTSVIAKDEQFRMGDIVDIIAGEYEGGSAQIQTRIPDDRKDPCKVHQYYATITRKNLTTQAYVCHEDLKESK